MKAKAKKGVQPLYGAVNFDVECLDSGADQPVIGTNNSNLYDADKGRNTSRYIIPPMFKFWDGKRYSMCTLDVYIQLLMHWVEPNGTHIHIYFLVVSIKYFS